MEACDTIGGEASTEGTICIQSTNNQSSAIPVGTWCIAWLSDIRSL